MNTRKNYRAARAAGESFSTAAAVTTLIFEVVAGFFKNSLPGFVKWVVAAGVGLIAACFSGRNALRAEEERERQREVRRNNQIQLVADVKMELQEIKRAIEEKRELRHVHGRVHQAYVRLDSMHKRASNDLFFKPQNEKTKLLDEKYSSSNDSDEEEEGIQLVKLNK